MRFTKLQAAGNDFVIVEALTGTGEWPWGELAQAMCDRHFGVGADGLILVQYSSVADLRMRIFNSDGSEAEVSGNGLRCFAKYVIEKGLVAQLKLDPAQSRSRYNEAARFLAVETLSGVRKVKAYLWGNEVNRVEVSMGLPQFQPKQIPVEIEVDIMPILDYPLVIDGRRLTLSILSIGNPHAVTFLSEPVGDFPLAEIGPKVEKHPIFPRRTNFEVARVLSRRKIEARVWERGVGETLACGSGACAIAVAAQLLGYIGREVDITLPGGTLSVSWDGGGEVVLAGSVKEVFTGEWPEGNSYEISQKA